MRWPFARTRLPASLVGELGPEETVQSLADLADGGNLAVTRFGLWVVPADGPAIRTGWEVISKVRWEAGVLTVIVADVVGDLGGVERLVDRAPVEYQVAEPRKTTDHIHTRTRGSILQAAHHDVPGGGAWVILRKVPGVNGFRPQVRLDPGTDPDRPGLATVVTDLVETARIALQGD